MNPLFYYLLQKDLHNFKHSLDNATKQPSSLGKSWQSATATEQRCDVNQRDDRGRTCLHLIASMQDDRQLDFARLALSQLNINVNLQDAESGWTALHRAMYGASISFARLLLARDDVELSIKDREGYTAFDLYNLTIEGGLPDPHHSSRSELYTWGTNRNYVLGNTHGDDRQLPERISIKRCNGEHVQDAERFKYLNVSRVFMSKLHTGIITEEDTDNVRFCGFGNGGRLGRSVHTQYAFETPSSLLDVKAVVMALAQDHTLLLDSDGHVYSFGFNKYQQLGYAVDTPTSQHAKFTNSSDPFQITPKRIVGALKKEVMDGVAAGKTASACWKNDTLYTWGTNEGHLGYDKSSTPVQSTPRKVTSIKQNVEAVAISDRSMGVLTDSGDVTVFYNSAYVKVSFPHFKSDKTMAGTAASMRPTITKLKCSSNTFGALSSLGEVFIFASPNEATTTIKPQKVWSFRNKFTAVRDFDVGRSGTIILCTVSGSVFVKSAKSTLEAIPPSWKEGSKAKSSKFSRVPYLHRVSEVHASDSGAFAALRNPPAHKPIHPGKDTLGDEMDSGMYLGGGVANEETTSSGVRVDVLFDEDDNSQHDDEDGDIDAKIAECEAFFYRYNRRRSVGDVRYSDSHVGGFDMNLKCNNGELIPFHKSIYTSRSSVLKAVIEGAGGAIEGVRLDGITLKLPDSLTHPLTLHILNRYLYTDSLLSIWDPRVVKSLLSFTTHDQALKLRDGLRVLCKLLSLRTLEPNLETLVVREIPKTLGKDLESRHKSGIADGDVRLNFSDNKYAIVDSLLLKTRTGFFNAMFDNPIWTESRRVTRHIEIDMTHMRLETFRYILQYIYGYSDNQMLNITCADLKEYLHTLFEIIEYANELMMDRLKLVVSNAIRPFITLNTAVETLQKAHFYECHELVDSILVDLTTQLESVLEKHALDDIDGDLLQLLEKHIRDRQNEYMPIKQVYSALLDNMVESNREWLQDQDIPQPILQTHIRYWNNPKSPKFGPLSGNLIMSPKNAMKPQQSPLVTPVTPDIAPLSLTSTANIPPIDDIFDMDDDRPAGSASGTPAVLNPASRGISSPWQQPPMTQTPNSAESAKIADFRSIIQAEAEASTPAPTSTPGKLYSQSPLSGGTVGVGKISQKEKRKLAYEREKQERDRAANAVSVSPSTSSTPAWRVPERRTSVWGSAAATGQPNSPNASTQPTATRSVQSNVIVPTREKGKKVSTQSGNAWSQAPAFASPPLNTPPGVGIGEISASFNDNSFEAIQSEQHDQALLHSSHNTRKKKSMVEIQMEEREREEEEGFLKWWAEEERRTKEAMGVGVRSEEASNGNRGGGRGGRGRGRGRGSSNNSSRGKPSDRGSGRGKERSRK